MYVRTVICISCSVEWLLRYVLTLKKTKHTKQMAGYNESEEFNKQIEQTIAVLQRYVKFGLNVHMCVMEGTYMCTYG